MHRQELLAAHADGLRNAIDDLTGPLRADDGFRRTKIHMRELIVIKLRQMFWVSVICKGLTLQQTAMDRQRLSATGRV